MWDQSKLMFSTIFLLYVFTQICDSLSVAKKQKVCVIGAGPSGLPSAKQLAEYPNEFDVVVFEKNSDVGGMWNYYDRTDVDEHNLPLHSPMYKHLRTNTPKEAMAFPDYRHWNGKQSSVPHQSVLSYLRNFTDHFNIRQYIQFNTLVEKVTTLPSGDNWRTTKYEIEAKNLNTNETVKAVCDAVMVANGHETEPIIPDIPGLENFSGKVIHSISYRVPEEYTGKTIIVLGASVSGFDISIQISDYAKKIYLSHNNPKIDPVPSNIEQVAGVAKAVGNTLILRDGTNVTADAFIFCTGYRFYVPFLDETSGITVHEKYISPLYKYIVNVEHPSMAFIGVPKTGRTFPSFYLEAKYFVQLLRGYVILPDKQTMLAECKIKNEKYPFSELQVQRYFGELAKDAKFQPLPAYYEHGSFFRANPSANLITFRDYNLQILNDKDVAVFHKSVAPAKDLHL